MSGRRPADFPSCPINLNLPKNIFDHARVPKTPFLEKKSCTKRKQERCGNLVKGAGLKILWLRDGVATDGRSKSVGQFHAVGQCLREFKSPPSHLIIVKKEEEKILAIAAIRKLKTKQLSGWEKDFIRNVETRVQRGELTEKQKTWLNKLKEKYLQKSE